MIYLAIILLNFFLFLNLQRFSRKINIFDISDKKLKIHIGKIPLVGGLIFLINLFFVIMYQYFFQKTFLILESNFLEKREIFSILILFLGFFSIGLYDDKYKLLPNNKIFLLTFFTLVAILLNKNLVISNIQVSFLKDKIFFKNFSIFFTIFCFLLLVNALNFYDGINGQSLIFFLFIFFFLFFKSQFNNFYLISILILFFILFLNLKNKIFLGDGGVYLLSALVSVCLIYEFNIKKSFLFVDEIFFLLLIPGFDLLRLTITRILSGQNAFYGDRNHLHHLLIKKFSVVYSNIILLFLGALPVISFTYLKLNFFFVLFISFVLFSLLIFSLKKK